MVYFVSSIGATSASESIRRETRYALTQQVQTALERLTDPMSSVDLTVRALGVVNLLEMSAADALGPSGPYRTLGKAKFRKNAARMMHTIVTV
jgi:hypothetical protein